MGITNNIFSESSSVSIPVSAAPASSSKAATPQPLNGDTVSTSQTAGDQQSMHSSTPRAKAMRQTLITKYYEKNGSSAQAKKPEEPASSSPTPLASHSAAPAVLSPHSDTALASSDGASPPPPSAAPSGADKREPPHPTEIRDGNPAHMVSANQATEDQRKILEQQVKMQRDIANEQMSAQIAMAGIAAQQTLVTSLASSIVNGAAELGKINKEGNQAALSAL